jgi:putative iron-dependent peroxidase
MECRSPTGYSRFLWVVQFMLHRMSIGDPLGAYDRLLDFSMPLTGTIFSRPCVPRSKSSPKPRRK